MSDDTSSESRTPDDDESDGSPPAEKTIMVELTQREYNSLSGTKEANGFTWKGMLMHAQRCLRKEKDC